MEGFSSSNDFCCSHHQFRVVVHPLSGPADGRTVMLMSLKKILPAPVIHKKSPSGRFPDDEMMQDARSEVTFLNPGDFHEVLLQPDLQRYVAMNRQRNTSGISLFTVNVVTAVDPPQHPVLPLK